MPEDWDDLDEAFKRARPVWNTVGVHLWHDITDEGFMLEIRLSWRYGARMSYSHLSAYWFAYTCDCDECRDLRRKLKVSKRELPSSDS